MESSPLLLADEKSSPLGIFLGIGLLLALVLLAVYLYYYENERVKGIFANVSSESDGESDGESDKKEKESKDKDKDKDKGKSGDDMEDDEVEEAYDYNGKEIAFKGAEGFGSYASGGKGGKVYYVTNLSDDEQSEGSLRYGVKLDVRPLVIRFQVSGNIELENDIKIKEGRLTIDGRDAPGKGVCLTNAGIKITADEVIVRYIRVRPGVEDGSDAINIRRGKNIIIDHCSCSWGGDEIVSVNTDTPESPSDIHLDNVTIQWCFIYEAFGSGDDGGHRFASILSAGDDGHVSFLNNVIAHCDSRNPRMSSDAVDSPCFVDFRNNVIYNWGKMCGYNGSEDDYPIRMNIVGNVYMSGEDTRKKDIIFNEKGSTQSRGYYQDNEVDGDIDGEQYNLVTFTDRWSKSDINEYKNTPPFDIVNTDTKATKSVLDALLSDGGCNLPGRDSADERIVNDIKKGTGTLVEKASDYKAPALS